MDKKLRKEINNIAKILPVMTEVNGDSKIPVNHKRRMAKAYQSFGDIGVANYVKSVNEIIKSKTK